MLASPEVAAADLSAAQIAMFPIALAAVFFLVRWWMTEKDTAIRSVEKEQAEQGKEVVRLGSVQETHGKEIEALRDAKHRAASKSDVQAQEVRCYNRHRGHDVPHSRISDGEEDDT